MLGTKWLLNHRMNGGEIHSTIVITKPVSELSFLPYGYLHIVLDSYSGAVAVHGLDVIVAYPKKDAPWARRVVDKVLSAKPRELQTWQLDTGIWNVFAEFGKRSQYTTGVAPMDLLEYSNHISEEARKCYEILATSGSTSNHSSVSTKQETSHHHPHSQTES